MVFDKLFSLFTYNNNLTSLNFKNIQQSPDNSSVIFLGPWLGEVGPELQYWIPFIQNLLKRDLLKRQKIIVVSRGGTETWYANITSNYIDLFDHLSQGEYQKIRSEVLKNSQKQVNIHPMERLLIDNIAKHEKITSYHLIHPSFMWKTIVRWLQEKITLDKMIYTLDFQPVTSIIPQYKNYIDRLNLPMHYFVVRFYTNNVFQVTYGVIAELNELIYTISRIKPVILLQTDYNLDDHKTIKLSTNNNVIKIGSKLPARINLGIQTELVRRSEGFIGTNGGFSILPGMLGKPVLSFTTGERREYIKLYSKHETITQIWNEKINNSSYTQIHLNCWKNLIKKLTANDNKHS